ncbi:disintegrin and metalloproteinase domain-containing protein 1b-like [Ctenodactylus gundi]
MKDLRLRLVASHSCIRLMTMLFLGIALLPSFHCHPGSAHYSSYEIVTPKSVTVNGSEGSVGRASYVLPMHGQKQLVHLKVNRNYFVSNFPVYSYHNGILGQEILSMSRDCHYEGYIEGVLRSFASVNTCSGLRGILIEEETSYGIEPVLSSKQFEHVLYRMASETQVSCGVASKDGQMVSASQQEGSRKPHNPQAPSYLWSHTKYVEMFVVVSNQRFQMWGSDVKVTVQRVVDIVALANTFTRGINTEIVLAGMEIWTEGDLTEIPGDLQVTLRNFNSWRQEKLFPRVRHDVAHMIIGHHPGDSTGHAFLNGACSRGFAAAVLSLHHEDVLLFAALMVHELGHNLGIQHDHAACLCQGKRPCLMHENITKGSGFSNCSSDYFYHFLHEHKGTCLFNKPWHKGRTRRAATCGNGVVEDQEQCDCGGLCDNNPCCDKNCQLKDNAQCADGLCCRSCKLQKKGSVCRDPRGACDVPEYCDGMSGVCPENRHVQNGSKCHGTSQCLQGECMDPNIECSKIYGFGSFSAPNACYALINSKGNRFGNCGSPPGNPTSYVKCSGDNVMCGKLVCTAVPLLPIIKPTQTMIQVPHEDNWCWSMDATVHTGTDTGYMKPGISCGPNKACKDYQCSQSTEIIGSCDPEKMCNARGVCNDLGNCHCDDGYAPPGCSEPGTGGSVDSGPTDKPSDESDDNEDTSSFSSLIAFIFLGLLVICVIICGVCICIHSVVPAEAPPEATEKVPEVTPPADAPVGGLPEEASEKEIEEEEEEEEKEEEEEEEEEVQEEEEEEEEEKETS